MYKVRKSYSISHSSIVIHMYLFSRDPVYLERHSLVQANLSDITGRIIGAVGALHQL